MTRSRFVIGKPESPQRNRESAKGPSSRKFTGQYSLESLPQFTPSVSCLFSTIVKGLIWSVHSQNGLDRTNSALRIEFVSLNKIKGISAHFTYEQQYGVFARHIPPDSFGFYFGTSSHKIGAQSLKGGRAAVKTHFVSHDLTGRNLYSSAEAQSARNRESGRNVSHTTSLSYRVSHSQEKVRTAR